MYDLLIKGGRVIDPAQNVDDKLDVGITGGKITSVAKDIPSSDSQRVVSAKDKIVTPGLIEMHAHIYAHVLKINVEPDSAGVKQGVTTVVDAGSSGEAIFGGFLKYIIPSSSSRIFCFLNLASQGLSLTPEFRDWYAIKPNETAAAIESNLDVIKGIKLRFVGRLVAEAGVEVVKTAKKIAKKFGLPIMVHVGDAKKEVSQTLTRKMLSLLESGDILAHCYTAQFGGPINPDGTIVPELRDAIERGVILDAAVGRANLNYDIASKGIAQGILPMLLSTDLTAMTLAGPAYGLTVTMSKFLALGLELKEIIRMTTTNPARVLKAEDKIGSLKPGMDADVSIVEVLSGKWKLESDNEFLETDNLMSPVLTIKSGQVIAVKPVARPLPVD